MPSGRWASSNRRAELPPNWRSEIRPRILSRDGHRCTWMENGHRCPNPATDVDHAGDPLDHSDAALRSLCADHHKQVTQGQAQAARAANPRKRPPEAHPGLRR